MINLLPPKEKDILKLERAKNLTIILCGTILVSLICLVLILLSVKFSVLTEASYQKSVLEQTRTEYQSRDATNLKNVIKKYNEMMSQVSSFYQKQVYFSDILANISEISRPQGIYFFNISLDGRKYEDGIGVSIFGKSDTRNNLLLFKKNIEAQNKIKNIYFSPENWINPTNINFKFTFDFLRNGN